MDSRRRTTVAVAGVDASMSSHVGHQLLSIAFVLTAQLGVFRSLASLHDIHSVLARVTTSASILCILWFVSNGQVRRLQTVKWAAITSASVLLYLRNVLLLYTLSRVHSTRLILLLQYAPTISSSLSGTGSKYNASIAVFSLVVPFIVDVASPSSDLPSVWLVYASLVVQIILSNLYEHSRAGLAGRSFVTVLSVVGAAVLSIMACIPGFIMSWPLVASGSLYLYFLTAIFLGAATFRYAWAPKESAISGPAGGSISYLITLSLLTVVMYVGQGLLPTASDAIAAISLFIGIHQTSPSSAESSSILMRTSRSYLNSILSNAESRKIFYFLMLNMCYMLVQMLYGIWTNSLGLISDAIHMAFDCMAIGVGLVASVMARWPPNERYTYGYSRIETLSGFSNGIFLVLISVFIVFEAIQRILSPPEMNTNQLLLVSSIGLAVNLFGMFAMGGHHHHGHTHSHGHSHSSSEADDVLSDPPLHHDYLHSHDRPHLHDHSHTHDDVHSHDLLHSHSHSSLDSHDVDECVVEVDVPRIIPNTNDAPLTPSYQFEHDDHLEHFHGQQHSSHDTHEGHSHNMRGVFLHVMADTLGSVGVIVSTLLIQLYGWTGFDPIASLFIAVLIAASVVPLIADTGKVLLLDLGNEHVVRQSEREMESMQGINRHSGIFWPKNDSTKIGTVHLNLAKGVDHRLYQIMDEVDHTLRTNVKGLEELTIYASVESDRM